MQSIQAKVIDGTMYVSSPSVIVKAGVLGKSLLTQTEMEKSLQAWNGISLTMNHPQIDGDFVGINQAPDFNIGFFDEPVLDGDRIKGRMWLNTHLLSKYEEVGALILDRIVNDVPTDVSTSYYYDKQQGPGQFNGETYEYATLNITPDHIAILPEQVGNCSWTDGCGIPRTNAEDEEQSFMLRRQLLHNSFYDTQSGETSMDEQQVNKEVIDPVVEEEVVEVNELDSNDVAVEEVEVVVEPSQLDAFIEEVGFEAFATAIRSAIDSDQVETNALVANAASATGLGEAELRKLSNEALRTLTNNKREKFAAVGGGLRSNSNSAEADNGWVAYEEVAAQE